MNILVFIKQVIDNSVPLDIDYKTDTVRWTDTGCYALNPADGWAVQCAVRSREAVGEGKVTAVSFGPERAVRALRECLALGADVALRVESSDFPDLLDPLGLSSVLAGAISILKPDLVLCGAASADTAMRSLGPILAGMVNLPHVPDVVDFEIDTEKRSLIARRQLARGDREHVRCPVPALLTLANVASFTYPSLPMMMRAWRSPVRTFKAEDLDLSEHDKATGLNGTRLVKVSTPRPRPKKIFIPDSSLPPEERLKQLLAGGPGRQKPANFLEGSPADVAAQAIEFMEQQKLW